ncbi:MAG: ATP-binding protein, partial [Polyangiales bacterium]
MTLPSDSLDARRLLELFNQAPGFLCYLDGPSHVFELANSAYYQVVGHRELLGKPVREALPEVVDQGFIELLDRVRETGEPFVGHAVRLNLQRAPNTPLEDVFVDFVYQPIVVNERVIGILVQGQDVTELKRVEAQRAAAQAALRESEERYRSIFTSIDQGFCLMQLLFDEHDVPVDYRFLELNDAFERQTGLRNALGKTARELVPDLDASWFELYGRVAKTGETTRFENHAPAMQRWFDVYASRVGAPELRQVALVFKDITERKQAEDERHTLLQLESAARERAEAAGRMKDEFLSTLSHELRTPLNAILGWTQLLRANKLEPGREQRALETIERNARSQAQLINDLLDISGILAGKVRLNVEPVDLRSVIEAARETVQPTADTKEVRIQSALDSGCSVMGDPGRLQQVVWNIANNAVKFTPRGGRIQLTLECRDSYAVISVTDTGAGIDPEFLPYVFERFRQQDGGVTRQHGGLGLGLSIVKQLVEMHSGTVEVKSEGKNRGATFIVRIPLALMKRRGEREAHGRSEGAHDADQQTPELTGLHVVVVDDERDARELLRAVLEGCGARVRSAASAQECRVLIAQERPELIISDIGMPGEDGY